MRRSLLAVYLAASAVPVMLPVGPAAAAPAPCPAAFELSDLEELQEFVEEAGGDPGEALIAFFEFVDENDDGWICFKTLPEATPFPTPPLLAGDNR